MPVVIPEWLKAPDVAGDYQRGLSLGVQVAGERARLQQEAVRTQMEYQARQQTQQQEALREQARLKVQQAYEQTQIALRQQNLQRLQEATAARTREAALTLGDKQGLFKDLQSGMPPEQAYFRHPRAASVANIEAERQKAIELGNQKDRERTADLEQQRLDLEKQRAIPHVTRTVTHKNADGTETKEEGPENAFPQSQDGLSWGMRTLKSGGGATAPTEAPSTYGSAQDVVSAYKAGKLSRADAKKLLTEQFGVKE
jgi:hypothetical protein